MPCGVVSEPRWLSHKDRQAGGRRGGREAAGDYYVCEKVNVYTLATHVQPMCSFRNASSSASHIGGGKKMRGSEGEEGGREKKHSLEGGQLFP